MAFVAEHISKEDLEKYDIINRVDKVVRLGNRQAKRYLAYLCL